MKSLKITLLALVALLAIAVGYGYGCGGNDDTSGAGDTTAAVESDGTSSTEASDGGDSTENSESIESTESTDEGDSSTGADGDGGSAPLSKAQFIKQGDAICQQVPTRYGKLLQEFEKEAKTEGKPKPSTAEGNLKAAVPPLPEAAEELEDLSPPAGDEEKAEAIVAALEAAAEGLEAKPSSELSGPKSPFAEFQKLTNEYGFKVCSQL